jgi:hypothetical protein
LISTVQPPAVPGYVIDLPFIVAVVSSGAADFTFQMNR